ncbi:LuxR C-terminal-related transcriptional regulator [Luteipulveratus sp. YIM 133296]|uniref:LuxR C-terminal-related transcriptional regulator n=1 Tax=Luteipulveratus flavus TaxID=3031728 RepID=A0ABT6C2Z8_9MICO|nr:LuxR C-terminal-related transcriptional regulator [Luteipulveratus sp. YIM 133296]
MLRGVMSVLAEQADDISLVQVAACVADMLPSVQDLDLVLLDISVPGDVPAEERVHLLTGAGVPVVLFTAELRPARAQSLIRLGARGLILKSDDVDTLAATIRQVAAGEFGTSSHLADSLAHDASLVSHLAPRELTVLRLLADGIPKKAIGRHMEPPVSAHTVDTYLQRIAGRYAQLGRPVANAYGSVWEATRDGHLDL